MEQTAVLETKPIAAKTGISLSLATSIAFVVFFALNAFKIALFNGYLIQNGTDSTFYINS